MIRPLEESDIAALAAALAGLPLMQHYRRTAAALTADLGAARQRGDGLLVAADGTGIAGLAWFLPSGTFALGGYLKLLAVVPGATGQGTGARLLAAFERAVRERSRHAFLLVSDFNRDAQRFYQRHGYVQVGCLPALVLPDTDELVYWKRLAPAAAG